MIVSFTIAALFKGIFLVINRITSWFGSLYFIRKGHKKKKRRYYLVGITIWIIMFGLLLLGFAIIAHYRHHLHQQVRVKIENPLP